MQQINQKNTRSVSRPLIWFTLAIHIALGSYLYAKTTNHPVGKAVEPSVVAEPRP